MRSRSSFESQALKFLTQWATCPACDAFLRIEDLDAHVEEEKAKVKRLFGRSPETGES